MAADLFTSLPTPLFTSKQGAAVRAAVPGLVEHFIYQLIHDIGDYDNPKDDRYDQNLRDAMSPALDRFIDWVSGLPVNVDDLRKRFRRLGKIEFDERQSLKLALSAVRQTCVLAREQLATMASEEGWPDGLLPQLNKAAVDYADQLSEWMKQGFQARLERACKPDTRRALASSMVAAPPPSRSEVDKLADEAGYSVPDQVTVIALQATQANDAPTPPHLDVSWLADLEAAGPFIIVPGEADREKISRILPPSSGWRAAVGPTVPLASANRSLRIARRALEPSLEKFFKAREVIFCNDPRTEDILAQDVDISEMRLERLLVALAAKVGSELVKGHMDTLVALGKTNFVDAEAARILKTHPHSKSPHAQTVRRRRRTIIDLFDPESTNPMSLAGLMQTAEYWVLRGKPLSIE